MTNRLQLIAFCLGALLLLLSNSSNPPNGKTGAPGENTCNQCHTGSNSALDGELTITGLPTSVDANTTYPITLTLTNPNGVASRGGFQWVAIDENNANAGDLANASTGSAFMTSSGREYHEHSGMNFFSGAPLTWTADWTAPNLPTGTQVTFHAAGVIGNGSGSANDRVRVISESTTINASTEVLEVSIASQSDPSCHQGSDGEATLTVTGGTPPYFYDWDNGEDTNPATQLEAGTTSVEISDSNDNTITTTVTLQEPSEIQISEVFNNSPLCLNGLNGEAELEASGGNPPYQYTWSDGQVGPIATDLTAGFYTVQVTDDNNCIETILVTITEEGLPVAIGGSTSYCEGTSTTLVATSGYATYSWSTGDLTETIIVNSPNNYNVLVSDADGCTGIAYIDITEIPVTPFTISGPSEICPGNPIDLSITAEFESYEWSDGSTLPTLTIDTCATYTVMVTDSQGCMQLDSITVNCSEDLDIILIENTPVSCIGDCDGVLEAGLSNNSNASGSWSTGSTANRLTDLCPGSYTYTVVDATGCSASQTYEVVEPLALGLTIDTLVPPICHVDTTSFIAVHATGGVSPYFYFWPEDMVGDTITEFASGSYQVTVVDSKSCVDSFQVTVPDVLPLVIVVEQVVDVNCFGDATGEIITSAIGGHGGYIYQWNTGSIDQDIAGLTADTYALTVTDMLGCSETRLIPVTQNEILSYSSTVTPESETGANDGSITLTPAGGNGNYTYLWSNGETTAVLTDLAPGMYTCTISDDLGCQLSISENVNAGGCLIDINTVITHVGCNGDNNGSVSIEVINGIPPFDITIVDIDNIAQEANQLTAGDYVVIASDAASCLTERLVTITEPSALSIEIQVSSLPTCDDIQDGSAIAVVTGGTPPYNYTWDTGSNDPDTDLSASFTAVSVTDQNGCQISAGITSGFEDTLVPIIDLQPLTLDIAENGGIILPNPDAYNLSSSDNCSSLTFTYEYEPVVSCGTATYDVDIRGTDEAGNFTIGTTTLTVRDITPPTVNCPSDLTVANCEEVVYEVSATDNCGEQVTLMLTEGLESQGQFEVGTTLVNYTATDQDNNVTTCSFTVTRAADIPLTAIATPVSCFGGSDGMIVLDDNGITYTEVNANGAALDQLAAGEYTVTAIDEDGCTATTTITIDEPAIIALNVNGVTDEQTEDGNDGSISTSITGGVPPYQIEWYLDGVLTSDSTTDLTELSPGDYTAEIVDSNGCQFSSETIIVMEKVSSSVTDLSDQNIRLIASPNPATSSIEFSIDGRSQNEVNTLEIYTIQGQRVDYVIDPMELRLDISQYQTGIYLTRMTTDSGSYSVRWSKL